MKPVLTAALVLASVTPLCAGDWPTILGPTRDGVSTEKGIIAPWPKEGLKKIWDCELGIGFAPPVIADGKLFHFDRFENTAAAHVPRSRHRETTLEVRVPHGLRGSLRVRSRPACWPPGGR